MTKVNAQNWSQLDFLINNFYEIVEFKRGRGIYGDRVILKRQKNAECIFGEAGKLCEFYYMDANAVKELPRTVQERIKMVTRIVTTPECMNILCNFEKSNGKEPSEWALEVKEEFSKANTIDFSVLNDILIKKYRELGANFLKNLKKHREKQYFLAGSDEFAFISKEYADKQINLF